LELTAIRKHSAAYSRQSPLFGGHPTGLYRLKDIVQLDIYE